MKLDLYSNEALFLNTEEKKILSGQGITQVADDLGFEYSQHFTRMFKNVTGQTPSEFFAENSAKRLPPFGEQAAAKSAPCTPHGAPRKAETRSMYPTWRAAQG